MAINRPDTQSFSIEAASDRLYTQLLDRGLPVTPKLVIDKITAIAEGAKMTGHISNIAERQLTDALKRRRPS
jgi:hypothetical protein